MNINPGIGFLILILSLIELVLVLFGVIPATTLTVGGGIVGAFLGLVFTLQDL